MSRRLHVIVASTRPGRAGPTIANWFAAQVAGDLGFEVEVIDLATFDLPLLDEPHHPSERRYVHAHTRRWSASVAAADAYVLVMPEYNAGFTAPLKNALDYLYFEWHHKPVGFVSYGMTSMGLRAVEMIKPVLTALKMVPISEAVSIPLRSRLGRNGDLMADDVMVAAAHRLLTQLASMADTLKPLREPVETSAGRLAAG
jgi:NAD(P)H-dependent FMN reductase